MRSTRTGHRWAAMMVAAILMTLAAGIDASAQTFTTLANVDGSNGCDPYYSGVVQGTDGYLYGTTLGGSGSQGTVFKLSLDGTLTTLHSFQSTDGGSPYGRVTLGFDGTLYGTTSQGGTNNSCSTQGLIGCGTVFKITQNGSTVITLQASI